MRDSFPLSPPTLQPIDARRDEFRKYLERTGVLDMFTKVLSKLMTETDKPEDAIEFIRANLGDSLNDKDTILSLNQKLVDANILIEELRTKLRQYEPMEGVESETDNVPEPVAVPDTEADADPSPAVAAEQMQVETEKESEPVTAAPVEDPAPPVAAVNTPTPAIASAEPTTEKEEALAAAAPEAQPSTAPPPTTETSAEAVKTDEKEASGNNEAAAAVAPVEPEKPAEATAPSTNTAKPDEKMEN